MKTVELSTPSEHIEKVINVLAGMGGKDYLLLLSGGLPVKQLYNHLSFSFTYPFPADVGLTDELWGEFSQHSDSNELMVKNTGLMGRMRWEKSNFHPILSPKPTYPKVEAGGYELELLKLFEAYKNKVVAVLSMGLDGSIAGMVPGSETAVDSEKFVVSYDSREENKTRITVTAKCLMERIGKVILLVDTEEKCGVLNKLFKFENDNREFPVLTLKHMKDVTAFCYAEK
jgi:6-phosphogluconolactonase/glucosamine-6-phosphate isomerase/deaminase